MHLHDPAVSNPRILAALLQCIVALKAGQPSACLPLLLELYEHYGGDVNAIAPEIGADEEETYAWDGCYADDPCDHYQSSCQCDGFSATG